MFRNVFCVILAAAALTLCGCGRPSSVGELMLVDFEENRPLRYRLVSERQTRIDLTGTDSSRQSAPQTMAERLELVMVYTPVKVDPFGLTTLKVTCESAKVTRSSFSGRTGTSDAVESLPNMPFTLVLTPTGRIDDLSDFKRVVRELGDAAFAQTRAAAGRVKDPDMISDFIALQWYLWDTIASIDEPLDGLSVGSRWQARQLLPWPAPVPNPPTRITTYTLEKIVEENAQRKAHIVGTYALTDDFLRDIPLAYEGMFQMRGLFGFLRRYRFESISGGGTQVFNIDAGILEQEHQHYTMLVGADFMLPLGDSKPVLNVDQTITIELLK